MLVPGLPQAIRDNGTADDYKFVAAQFNKAGEACRNHHLKLAYHNHSFEFKRLQDGSTGYDILLKETDPALVSFEVDLFWAVKAGASPLTMFTDHPGRFTMWHVKDMDKNNKNLNTEIDQGAVNFKAIFAESKLSGVKHYFVEHETNYKPNEIGSVKTSFDFVNTQLI